MKLGTATILLILMKGLKVPGQSSGEVTTKSGLRYTVLKAGSGATAKVVQEVAIYE